MLVKYIFYWIFVIFSPDIDSEFWLCVSSFTLEILGCNCVYSEKLRKIWSENKSEKKLEANKRISCETDLCSPTIRFEAKKFFKRNGLTLMVMATSLYLCIYASLNKRLCVSILWIVLPEIYQYSRICCLINSSKIIYCILWGAHVNWEPDAQSVKVFFFQTT